MSDKKMHFTLLAGAFAGAMALVAPVAAQDIDIDVSASRIGVVNGQTLRIVNVEHAGHRYVVDLQWNAQALAFMPVRVASQDAAGLLCTAASYDGGTRVGTVMLQINAGRRLIEVSVVNDGPRDPWNFWLYNWRFVHNQTAYSLTTRPSDVSANTALINLTVPSTYSFRSLAKGERFVVGTIGNLPDNFDYSMPVTSLVYGNQTTPCQ